MSTATQMAPASKGSLWTGYVLSAIIVVLLLMGVVMNLTRNPQAVEGTRKMGYPENTMTLMAVMTLVCLVFYVIPRTAVLGAILLTGYFGGAVATHIRAGEGLNAGNPAMLVCTVVWVAIYLREPRLRALVPLRS